MSFAIIPKREVETWSPIRCCWKYMLRKASTQPKTFCQYRKTLSVVDLTGEGLGSSAYDGGPTVPNLFIELRETLGWERRGIWEVWVTKSCDDVPQIVAGLYSGGFTTVNVTLSDKLIFETQTASADAGMALTGARRALAGASNYLMVILAGGFTQSYTALTDKGMWFTDLVAAEPLASLTVARGFLAGAASPYYGMFVGGATSAGDSHVADKCEWSTRVTSAQSTADLTIDKGDMAATRTNTKGFFLGGSNQTIAVATTDKCVWAMLALSACPSASLTGNRRGCAGYSNNLYGFVSGGYTTFSGIVNLDSTDKLDNATDTVSAASLATLTMARRSLAATGYTTWGFFSGGCSDCPELLTDKIEMATGVMSAATSANLTLARHDVGGSYSI